MGKKDHKAQKNAQAKRARDAWRQQAEKRQETLQLAILEYANEARPMDDAGQLMNVASRCVKKGEKFCGQILPNVLKNLPPGHEWLETAHQKVEDETTTKARAIKDAIIAMDNDQQAIFDEAFAEKA
jgi:hypothetical protein